jgi:pentatricopeptide repeat protein
MKPPVKQVVNPLLNTITIGNYSIRGDVDFYNALLTAYRDKTQSSKVEMDDINRVWTSLKEHCTPNVYSYNTMIRACGEFLEVEKAMQVYREMSVYTVEPDLITYKNLIYACSKRGDFYVQCFEIYSQALFNNFIPDAHLYSILLYACARNSDISNAITLFHHMVMLKIPRDVYSYTNMLFAIAVSQSKVHAPLDVKPVLTYNKRFDPTEKENELKLDALQKNQVLELPLIMNEDPANIPTDKKIVRLTRAERIKMCERLLNQMKTSDVKKSPLVYHVALRIYTESGHVDKALQAWTHLYERWCSEENETVAQQFYSVDNYASMVQLFCNVRRLRDAVDWYERMKSDERVNFKSLANKQNKHLYDVYTSLLSCCVKERSEEDGSRILKETRNMGYAARDEHARMFDMDMFTKYVHEKRLQTGHGAVSTAELKAIIDEKEIDSTWLKAGRKVNGNIRGQHKRPDSRIYNPMELNPTTPDGKPVKRYKRESTAERRHRERMDAEHVRTKKIPLDEIRVTGN